jgi:hypothetical protein
VASPGASLFKAVIPIIAVDKDYRPIPDVGPEIKTPAYGSHQTPGG